MPDLLLDELYKKIQYQASFIHSYLCKGITQHQEGSCFHPDAQVKEPFDHEGTSLALTKPSKAPKEHGTSLRENRLRNLLTEAERHNDAYLRGYFNFKTGRSIALDSTQSLIMLRSSMMCKLWFAAHFGPSAFVRF